MPQDLETWLVQSMAKIPVVLVISWVLLHRIPNLATWVVAVILWVAAIAIGIAVEPAEEVKMNIVNGFVQGTIATGLAFVYWQGIQKLIKEE